MLMLCASRQKREMGITISVFESVKFMQSIYTHTNGGAVQTKITKDILKEI